MKKQKMQLVPPLESGSSGELVLITGGAGFIGSHLARRLLQDGHRVRALDNLDPQVHGEGARRPAYLEEDVELVVGDVRDPDAVGRALDGCDAVVHLAARVGVGQSMYQIQPYTSVNNEGTAVLLQALLDHPVRKLVVASSMSIYGEGLYRGPDGRVHEDVTRDRKLLQQGIWDPRADGEQQLEPVPTPESKRPSLSSIYALGKYDQERMCLLFGEAYDVPAVALRFFNVYGPDQALSNPYTGVLAIFAGRLLNERPPLIFEDGRQRRDFVSVHDVARACELALFRDGADGQAVNVGSGHDISVAEVAQQLARQLGREQVTAVLTGEHRVGDVRHCFADIGAARELLGYEPEVEFERGVAELAGWLEGQIAEDNVEAATAELRARGLSR